MVEKNHIVRYMDPLVHHYLVRYQHYNITFDIQQLSQQKNNNFAYLVNWDPQKLHDLRGDIQRLSALCRTVFVNFGEPSFMWNYPWDDTSRSDCPIYDTVDYINSFDEDNLVFFGNCTTNKRTKHPFHYINDMFYYGVDLYLNNKRCENLLSVCRDDITEKKFSWECMFSWSADLYDRLQEHPVAAHSLATCRTYNKTWYGDDVVEPVDMGGETFSESIEDRNVRTSDLIDPSIYNNSWYSMVKETNVLNGIYMFSEKHAKPIMSKRLFTVVGGAGQLEALRKLGFETFADVFDESFDKEPEYMKRYELMLDSMLRLSKEDPIKIYQKIKPILDHNYNHFLYHNWNEDFIMSWESPIAWCESCNL